MDNHRDKMLYLSVVLPHQISEFRLLLFTKSIISNEKKRFCSFFVASFSATFYLLKRTINGHITGVVLIIALLPKVIIFGRCNLVD